jgi:hypothetical protein
MIRKILLVFAFVVFITSLSRAETLEQLRNQFKAEENRIVKYYDELARKPGVDKAQIKKLMKKALVNNRTNFSALAGKDPRYSQAEVNKAFESKRISEISPAKTGPGYIDEINAELGKKGLKLKSTGGSADLTPSHINADIDTVIVRMDGSPATAAEQLEGIKILERHGLNQGDIVQGNAARFDNKGKDLTVWKPETAEGQQAKLNDHDAFKTEGGKHSTRNPGAVQDAHGEVLDNQAKFEAARVEGDLKTQGKSLVKAGSGEASGIKTIYKDPKTNKETVVRDSDFQKRNPELYKKAKALKEYGTTHEAGITEVGDAPEVQQQKIEQFQREMAAEMDALEREGARKGRLRDTVRENFQNSYDNAGMTERAQEIGEERGRVRKSNQQAADAIAGDKVKPTAQDTYTGGRKGPGDAGFGAQPHATEVPGTSMAAKAKDALARLNDLEASAFGVSELPAGATGVRANLNAGVGKAMAGAAVVGTAYDSYSVSSKLSKAKILYEAAANEADDSMAKAYYEQAEALENEAADQVKNAVLVGGATMIAPVAAGGALVGVGTYQGTRAVLEGTETGRAIDEGIRGGMTSVIEGARDAATVASGERTYDEIAFDTLTERQSTWIEALRKDVIELEEGVKVDDLLTLIERNQDKIVNLQNLGYLKGVVRLKGSRTDDPGEQNAGEDEQAKLLEQLQALKSSIDSLSGQVQAVDAEVVAIEKAVADGVKNLEKELNKTTKELTGLAKEISALESQAGTIDAQNAQASKAADDAYNSGAKCAAARGAIENHAAEVCRLRDVIKATDNIQELEGYANQVPGEEANAQAQADVFREALNSARMASRQSEGILKEINTLRAGRDEASKTITAQENVFPTLQPQVDLLDSQIASLEEKTAQLPGMMGQASGILGQAQAVDAKKLNKEGKKVLKDIQAAHGRISKITGRSKGLSEDHQNKIVSAKDQLKGLTDQLMQAKSRMETLLSQQINDEMINRVQKFSEEARASYDAAQLFDEAVRLAGRDAQACAREAQSLYAKKISPEAQVARHDCSQWPGTVARWNKTDQVPFCECPSGNLWDEELYTCVLESDYYVRRTDCSRFGPNAHARWDAGQRQALCFCNDGYEWTNDRSTCRVSARDQIAQTDCSMYPNTVPTWEAASESVMCYCVSGYYWDGSQCLREQQPQYNPNAGQDFINAMTGLVNTINNNNNQGGSSVGSGNTWGRETITTTQVQGDPCERNFSVGMGGAVCQCNGYTFNSSQNKCIYTGATPSTNTGSGWVNTGYQGGGSDAGNSGGVDTSPPRVNRPCVYTGGVNTCDPGQ